MKQIKVYVEKKGEDYVTTAITLEKRMNRFMNLCKEAGSEVYTTHVSSNSIALIGVIEYEAWKNVTGQTVESFKTLLSKKDKYTTGDDFGDEE